MPKPLTVWVTTNWKILKWMGMPDHLTCLLRNLYAGQEATVRTRHDSKLVKKYVKAVYCHLVYLTYMQSTSCKMPECMKHKLESSFLGEISIISDMQMAPPYVRKQRTKEPLDESESIVEKKFWVSTHVWHICCVTGNGKLCALVWGCLSSKPSSATYSAVWLQQVN